MKRTPLLLALLALITGWGCSSEEQAEAPPEKAAAPQAEVPRPVNDAQLDSDEGFADPAGRL